MTAECKNREMENGTECMEMELMSNISFEKTVWFFFCSNSKDFYHYQWLGSAFVKESKPSPREVPWLLSQEHLSCSQL